MISRFYDVLNSFNGTKTETMVIRSILVVNSHTEYAVELFNKYVDLITHDHIQLEFTLQVVEAQHKTY